jgi:hypothetical protein
MKSMLSKIYKTDWLPVFGQSFVLVELENCDQAGRLGSIITVTFHGDRKTVTAKLVSIDAQLPKEPFSDEAILEEMAVLGQNEVKNQVYEKGKELKQDRLTYLQELSFAETNANVLLLSITHYRAFEVFKGIKFRSGGEFVKTFVNLHLKKDNWWFKTE